MSDVLRKSPAHGSRVRYLQGRAVFVVLIGLAFLVLLAVAVARSESVALYLIARAAGPRAMAVASGPERCCDARFGSLALGFGPLRVEVDDIELTRHDPSGARGGEALLAELPQLVIHLDAGALWSNRPAIPFVSFGEGSARIESFERDGRDQLRIDLDAMPLAYIRHVFSGASDLSGKASGEVEIWGSLVAPDSVEVDLDVTDAVIRIQRFDIQGHVVLEGDVDRKQDGLEGTFEFDVSEAKVEVASAYTKPAGTAGTISGKLASGEGGRIEARDFNYQAKQARVRIEL
jgi:hypothetical protein